MAAFMPNRAPAHVLAHARPAHRTRLTPKLKCTGCGEVRDMTDPEIKAALAAHGPLVLDRAPLFTHVCPPCTRAR